jgi:hypothetical protein
MTAPAGASRVVKTTSMIAAAGVRAWETRGAQASLQSLGGRSYRFRGGLALGARLSATHRFAYSLQGLQTVSPLADLDPHRVHSPRSFRLARSLAIFSAGVRAIIGPAS